jgi:hypothetical protein
MVYFRYIIVNNLHTGNNNNNNNRDGGNARTSDLRSINSNIRRGATKCFPGTWFVSGIYV